MNKTQHEILIVDDNSDNLRLLAKILKQENHIVRPALNGKTALQYLNSSPVDLILLDIVLPDMDGFEICRKLKSTFETSDIPVIFITANKKKKSDIVKGFELGAADYITKPFNPSELLARVNTHLALKQARDTMKAAIREKMETAMQLQAVFQSIPDTVITIDSNMQIISSNRDLDLICNPDKKKAKYTLQERLSSGTGPCWQTLYQSITTQKPVKEFRTECRCENRDRVLVLNTVPLKDSEKNFRGVVMVMRDISRMAELEKNLRERHTFRNIIGKSEKMQTIFNLLEQASDMDVSVLITGESGTGKELIAEALHYGSSRAGMPLVKVNCSALPENLLESELFGHVKGAFTGAVHDRIGRIQAAQGGTLFLDEIGEISPRVQLSLLRFLDRKEYERLGDSKTMKADVRLIAATNSNLMEKVRKGLFREDLYYRLHVMVINMPPLRERTDDIPLLCSYFVRVFQESFNKNIEGISADVMKIFLNHTWQGNVRELKHTLEHACVLCPRGEILVEHLPAEITENTKHNTTCTDIATVPMVSRSEMIKTLEQNRWNKAETARALGIGRNTLYRYIKRYNVRPDIK